MCVWVCVSQQKRSSSILGRLCRTNLCHACINIQVFIVRYLCQAEKCARSTKRKEGETKRDSEGGRGFIGHPQMLTTATLKIYCGDLFALSITYFPCRYIVHWFGVRVVLSFCLSVGPSVCSAACSLFIYSFSNLLMFVWPNRQLKLKALCPIARCCAD